MHRRRIDIQQLRGRRHIAVEGIHNLAEVAAREDALRLLVGQHHVGAETVVSRLAAGRLCSIRAARLLQLGQQAQQLRDRAHAGLVVVEVGDQVDHHVAQLAHVARPVVGFQQAVDVLGNRPVGQLARHQLLQQEGLREDARIPAPFAQRRAVQVENRNAFVEVLAEQPGGHPLLQVLVGRADHLDIDMLDTVAAQGVNLALLQEAQQHAL